MIGKTISHYRILSKLGAGGMGVVYKAEDTKLKRTVALKFLPPELTRDDQAKTRFIHEAQAASALQHNNICAIHEIDETPEGQLFISMDCYQGETLKEKIARGPLSIDEAIDIASQVAAGLSKAHEAGMVHRDVKPANIMVTTDGVVKILDFGLAKLAGMTKVTRTGTTVGTVAYMSPEQARGEEVDARSDIFSLGAVLYEMLTGKVPFPGDHEAAVLYGIMSTEPRPVREFRTDIPDAIGHVIAKAMNKDAPARYRTAAEMNTELEAVRSGPGRMIVQGKSAARRRGLRSWMAVGIGAIVIVTGLIALIQLRPSGRSPDMNDLSLAVMDFRDLVSPNDLTTAAGITTLVNVGLTESSSIRVISPEYIYDIRRRIFGSGRGAMDEDQRMAVARKSGSTLFLAAEISGTQGERYVAWRLVDTSSGKNLGAHRVEGKTLAEIADRIIEGVMPLLPRGAEGATPESPSSVSALATSSEEAYRCYVKGLLALEQYRDQDAIAEFERAVAVDSSFALAYYHLAYAHYKLSLSMQGLPRGYTEKAWAHRDRLGVRERMSVEAFRHLLDGDWSGSIRAYREILARWPDDRTTLGILSRNLFMGWWYEQALSISQQGLALYPDETVLQVVYQNGLAFLGRREEALVASRGFVKAHPDKEYLLNELGQRYWEVGMPDSAEAVFQKVLLLHPGDWLAQQSISSCYYSRGDVNGAIGMLERLVKRPDLLDDQRRRVFVIGFAGGLAALPAEIGRYEHSFELLREYKSCESASEATAAVIEARLLQTMGRAQEAVDSARTRLKRVSTSNDSVVIELAMTEALAEAGSTEEARSTLSRIRESDENILWGRNRFRALLLPCIIALAEGDAARALELVHELERFGKPPATELAVHYREALARSYWKSGRLEHAVRAYADLLNIFGGHAVSHYELGQVYEQMGRPADAKREYGKFLEMWSEADEGLPQLVDARQRLARL